MMKVDQRQQLRFEDRFSLFKTRQRLRGLTTQIFVARKQEMTVFTDAPCEVWV